MSLTESDFFRIAHNRVGDYTLKITRAIGAGEKGYVLEWSVGRTIYRVAGFTPVECMEYLLGTQGLWDASMIGPRGKVTVSPLPTVYGGTASPDKKS